ncbi:hypothetical protein [Streptomyces sp. NBC_00120]|uniref:hypothetical protein n=1 Tax=Streptomyces sp. NBC_00120 TaxID=2975660 RepID=UPI002254A67C|nr:hypothetical protein [Streptomyces sp. NBC_00120]MCX5320055.1 hypothetical protein [Streptomyces sp. NBC_00120]
MPAPVFGGQREVDRRLHRPVRTQLAASSDELRVIIDLVSGCGHRNGEAYAANMHRMVADDVYRITEQIDGVTRERARLKQANVEYYSEILRDLADAGVRIKQMGYAPDAGALRDEDWSGFAGAGLGDRGVRAIGRGQVDGLAVVHEPDPVLRWVAQAEAQTFPRPTFRGDSSSRIHRLDVCGQFFGE